MHASLAVVCHHYNFAVRCRALVRRDFAWIITRLDLRLLSKHRRVAGFNGAVHKGTSRHAHKTKGESAVPPEEPWIGTKMIPAAPSLTYL